MNWLGMWRFLSSTYQPDQERSQSQQCRKLSTTNVIGFAARDAWRVALSRETLPERSHSGSCYTCTCPKGSGACLASERRGARLPIPPSEDSLSRNLELRSIRLTTGGLGRKVDEAPLHGDNQHGRVLIIREGEEVGPLQQNVTRATLNLSQPWNR